MRPRCSSRGRIVEHVDAIVLTGGSAFGLATADGVMRALAEQGRGFPTRGGPVPIVPAAAIFDLVDVGRRAARARARAGPRSRPRRRTRAVRARAGAAPAAARRSASGAAASTRCPAGSGRRARARRRRRGRRARGRERGRRRDRRRRRRHRRVGRARGRSRASRIPLPFEEGEHTTLVVVATNARCSPSWSASSSPRARTTGWRARSTRRTPATTATSRSRWPPAQVDAHLDRLRVIASEVTAEAIRAAVAYHRDRP